MQTYPVIIQPWTEYERGWGRRDDGLSVHTSRAALAAFVEAYSAKHHTSDVAPDDYSMPDGNPEIVDIPAAAYEVVKSSGNGLFVRDRMELVALRAPSREDLIEEARANLKEAEDIESAAIKAANMARQALIAAMGGVPS